MSDKAPRSRRDFLQSTGVLVATAVVPSWLSAAVAQRAPTRSMTAGPFYPAQLPLDRDNDLLHYAQGTGAHLGTSLNLTGTVTDESGRALSGVRVEIWQCDANGVYHHVEGGGDTARLDRGFQGYGEYTTGADGDYAFRTIRPVPYSGRTPHIHFRLSGEGFSGLTTQMFVAG